MIESNGVGTQAIIQLTYIPDCFVIELIKMSRVGGICVTKITGSISDDGIYYHLG
jgi:hypothetical protein